jgi:hypothetical protein
LVIGQFRERRRGGATNVGFRFTKLLNYQISRLPKSSSLDPAEQLQRIYLAGFELQTFDRFPKCIGVSRDGCIALLVPGVAGLQILGTPGWKMGEAIGVLVEKDGPQVFQYKQELVEATTERLRLLERFKGDLKDLLAGEDGALGKTH